MKLVYIVLLCLVSFAAFAQDQAQVPPDVNYKPASEAVNNIARDALQRTLTGDKAASKQMLFDVLTCGPMLWQSIQPIADKRLVDAKKIVAVIGVPTPKPTEGRTFVTDEERQKFWSTLFKKYPTLASPTRIRKANAWEISYYYATVPFDIQEPFFSIEAGSDVFIANMRMVDGKPVLFWIDIVANFQNSTVQNAQEVERK